MVDDPPPGLRPGGQLEAFVQTARRTSERATQLADEAGRKLSETPLAPR
jgi:hypothetical protein